MWDGLQSAQNAALKTVTGCLRITGDDHLHAECKMMPIKDHCNMLSKQFHLATRQDHHPNNKPVVTNPPRLMRKTLDTEFGEEINNMIPPDGLDNTVYKSLIKQIHTNSVSTSIANLENNRVLDEPAPPVDKSENQLPRRARTLLARYRSGFSNDLNSYMARIREDPTLDFCPKCNQPNHNTDHLFNCTQNPTNLTTRDLWLKPVEVARFLGLLDENQDEDENG